MKIKREPVVLMKFKPVEIEKSDMTEIEYKRVYELDLSKREESEPDDAPVVVEIVGDDIDKDFAELSLPVPIEGMEILDEPGFPLSGDDIFPFIGGTGVFFLIDNSCAIFKEPVRIYQSGMILSHSTGHIVRPAPRTLITPQKSIEMHKIKHDLVQERVVRGLAQSAKKKTGDILVDAGQAVTEGAKGIMDDIIAKKGAVQHRSRALGEILELADLTPSPRNPRMIEIEDKETGKVLRTDLSTAIELLESGNKDKNILQP